jgi:hypothetical protein
MQKFLAVTLLSLFLTTPGFSVKSLLAGKNLLKKSNQSYLCAPKYGTQNRISQKTADKIADSIADSIADNI